MTLSTTRLHSKASHSTESEHLYESILTSLETEEDKLLRETLLHAYTPAISNALRRLDDDQRVHAWSLLSQIDPELAANLIDHLSSSQLRYLAEKLPIQNLQEVFPLLQSPDRRMLLTQLPLERSTQLNTSLPNAWQKEEKAALNYESDTVGGICNNEMLKVDSDTTVAELSHLISDDDSSYNYQEWRYVYLQDRDGNYLGAIRLKDLFGLPFGGKLKEHLNSSLLAVPAEWDLNSLKSALDTTTHPVLPVIDNSGFQIGVVGFRQLNEALFRQSKQQLLEQAGVFGGDEFRTMPTAKRNLRRLAFLLPSVLLSYAAVSIIAQFEPVIEQFALLAAILPLVANLSGAAGNQAVAVSIRELSVGNLSPKDVLFVIVKELPIGIINGAVIGSVLALLSFLTYGEEHLALPILVSVAYLFSSTLAVITGGTLPLILKRLNLDPAMLSSPLLTTFTDAAAFFSVLYLAQSFLL
ncbi:magnesium transporter [Vibrio sp. 10N.286.55.E10]|uniref:magnesium transporter n=1 Tax=unclassified Vibrio TaxID=2614977 RepID=UPI000C83C185|nr:MULTISPECIES: magnesium transporter [unclassified Vibrio]PME27434.1 magnesium transporter [Vibrio sp. 10N.286.55.E12]PME36814.1 magnesium transporter [Vibrio sp. 10N.286.55.E10]PME69538.1 magnesium transporter [Vibrio sp. 10N.286.55.C11]PTQ05252.1 magnesium transporter [Vibrio sp. ZF 223]